MPMISIIVPVYNVEKYLNRCVDSILNQTFTDFELILVNDGSTDKSGEICDEYAEKDHRIKVIHKKNAGVSSTRNVGLENAVGEYIMFCDADDFVSEVWCEVMYKTALKYPNAWVVSNLEKVYDDNEILNHFDDKTLVCERKRYYWIYNEGLSGYCWNKIYKNDLIKKHNLSFDNSIPVAEDVKFNTDYLKLCSEIIYINFPLYYYYQNQNSALHKYYPNLLSFNLKAFYVRIPFVDKENIGEFCDTYLYVFCGMFDNVFDKQNKMSFIAKLKYNQKMINTKEMRYCIENCTGIKESKLYMKIIRKHNYYLLFSFQKLMKIKKFLKRGN